MKVKIADLVVRTREIELPDECPHCGSDLTREGGLMRMEVKLLFYTGKDLDSWLKDHVTDSTIPACQGYFCAECSADFEFGNIKEVDVVPPRSALAQIDEFERDTIWSACLDVLAFERTG